MFVGEKVLLEHCPRFSAEHMFPVLVPLMWIIITEKVTSDTLFVQLHFVCFSFYNSTILYTYVYLAYHLTHYYVSAILFPSRWCYRCFFSAVQDYWVYYIVIYWVRRSGRRDLQGSRVGQGQNIDGGKSGTRTRWGGSGGGGGCEGRKRGILCWEMVLFFQFIGARISSCFSQIPHFMTGYVILPTHKSSLDSGTFWGDRSGSVWGGNNSS